ncbi:hypothetical protein ASPVEDRAFT_156198 [Aspergillus versicolor CBS 583.65]|uniref:F-box domain-containing protein n=1 Tax=Aspergillus versicolor CBS 583.65 TaxID=1036611 RepID=A0A1L9Q4B9_ASPVE|nr:uncharacterized protein ASPVEDRAFT_156198 [Aspergillus versicolor CBS 583.65]OJJ08572.1 hypothetical protein ASPVEDRAFT_156198 [Aspergillus versicolor CBS 583.65]
MPVLRRSKRCHPVSGSIPYSKGRRSPKPAPTYMQRSQTDIDTDPNINITLLRLPREMFDEIVAYLPLPAKVCLSLSCKAAAHVLHPWTTTWFLLRRSTQINHRTFDRTLCDLLQRDHPELQFCPRCEVLHPPLKPPHAHRITKFTKLCLGQTASMDYWPQMPTGGYSIIFPHIEQAFQKPSGVQSTPIDMFAGDFTAHLESTDYRLISSASWIERGLVLKQEYRLRSSTGLLKAVDVTSLPFRICAHLSTTTSTPPESRHTKRQVPNGPLLTHAISTAFPENLRLGVASPKTFRPPSPAEQAQIAASAQKGHIWRCRSCPTKFRVEYSGSSNELLVTAWHFFGKELYKALEYWKMFVRREGTTLGPKTRNSEFFVLSRGIPDFAIE